VLVIDGDRVRQREVTIGIRGTRMVQVTDGLEPGTLVASPSPSGLRDGQRVRVTEKKAPQP